MKKRRISQKDWSSVQEFIIQEKKSREKDKFRKVHEDIWREVDRQVKMEPAGVSKKDINDDGDWHNQIELGELAKASEVLSADVRRLLFPASRAWFEAHSELPSELDEETGERAPDAKMQRRIDGRVRAFMGQQHSDFGLKARVDLSVKEALHHGSLVVEVMEDHQMMVTDGAGVQSLHAPVWQPHSMWNCYPDPSPNVIGTNMIYNGSMIICDYIPMHKLKAGAKGDGWMASQISKIKIRKNKNKDVETEDVERIKYYGDIVIKRNDGDIYLPNSKVILANGIIVYYSPVDLPFPPIIYLGYERLDVSDPYYTSPIIKLSPMQKMVSRLANKYLDAVDLENEPPIVYDGSDPNFVQSGGPVIAPGEKTPTRGSAKYEVITVGNSASALQGLQLGLQQISEGSSVDSIRAGSGASVEKTKFEVSKTEQRSEIRVVDFVDKLEFGLKTFLYMQHVLNKKNVERYPFYNAEMDAPDFEWMAKKELPENIHFEIVGAKGILGEEERTSKTMAVTAFASQNPLFADLLKPVELLKEAYQDAGNKNPERFINAPDNEMEAKIQQLMQKVQEQAQQAIEQYESQIHELKKQLDIQKAVNEAKVVEAQMKSQSQIETSQFKAELQGELDVLKAQLDAAKTMNQGGGREVSFKEVGQVVASMEKLLEGQEATLNAGNKELNDRLEAMNNAISGLLEKASKKKTVKINGKTIEVE